MNRSHRRVAAALIALLATSPAVAGPHADALGACLVGATSDADRGVLVQWMFAAMSRHPALRGLATVSPAQIDAANRRVATLLGELLTDACRSETENALQHEGGATLSTAFQVLGRVAGQEMFAHPQVAAAMSGIGAYLDETGLKAMLTKE